MATNLFQNANEQYFIDLCIKNFSENLLWIVNSDSYIRQPCYSSRARACYYLIFDEFEQKDLAKLKYVQGEFPEFFLNFLTKNELDYYPSQGKWQFCFSPIVYNKTGDMPIASVKKSDHIEAIRQAIFGIGHIARLYFLRDLDKKTHTWAVRQVGWAFRYAELGIVKLWNYIQTGQYDINFNINIKSEIEWLCAVNANWVKYEAEFLSDVEEYRKASLKLNAIVEYFSNELTSLSDSSYYVEASSDEYNQEKYRFIGVFRDELIKEFGGNLKAFYLHGSAARGDQHKNSDIDSIAVLSELDAETLKKLRNLLSKFKGISISTLSLNDLINYPAFRFYSICLGSKKMYGEITFKVINSDQNVLDGITNNLYTILQIARAYLLIENYGPRAPYVLTLMMKLCDHGCMRLIIRLQTGSFPDKKEEVKDFFRENPIASEVIGYLLNVNSEEEYIKNALLEGDSNPLKQNYMLQVKFVQSFLQKVKELTKLDAKSI